MLRHPLRVAADSGASVTFFEGNDLFGASHTYTVAGGEQIGATDLWLGWFSLAVDPSIARYPILDLPSSTDYIGLVNSSSVRSRS